MRNSQTSLPRRLASLIAAVGFATCALIALLSMMPSGSTRVAYASGLGATTITHTLATDFEMCTVLTGTVNRSHVNTIVSDLSGGEIRLSGLVEDYFLDTKVDASKWITFEPNFQSNVTEGNGVVTVTNAGLRSIADAPAPGRILEFRARMQPTSDNGYAGIGWGRQAGIGAPGSGCPGNPDCDAGTREFVKDPSVDLYAISWDGYEEATIDYTMIPGAGLTQYHLFRIEWDTDQTRYYFDGALVANATFTSSLVYSPYVWLSSLASYTVLEVDWVRVLYYPTTTGQYASCAIDTAQDSNWTQLSWAQSLPAGTAAVFETRSSQNGATWSAWAPITGSGGTIPSPNGRYLQYRINLTTTDPTTSPEINAVHISYEQNEAPIANPGGPYTVNEGQLAVYDGSASTDPNGDTLTAYDWDMNNNGSYGDETGITATKSFANGPSIRTIGLRVTDESGLTGTQTTTVTVLNVNPTVSALTVSAFPSNEGAPVTATASFSDPGVNDAPFTCAVNHGDGSGSLAGSVSGDSCTGPAHIYSDNGVYTVTVSITDQDGGTGNRQITHTVNNVAPVVSTPNVSTSPSNEGASVTASATFADPGASDSPFTCTVNYGDGSGNQTGIVTGTSCAGPAHAFADEGAYTVTVSIRDKDGATGVNTKVQTVNNVSPTVNTLGLSTTPSAEGSPITATATFTDPGINDAPFICAVNYGDGSGNLSGSVAGTSCTGPAHTFSDNGVYTVTVSIMDEDGGTGVRTRPHTVNNVAPSPSTTGPYTGVTDEPIAFNGQANDPGSADTHTYAWDFGDGITSTLQSPSHAYAANGVYTATLTVTDDDGGVGIVTTKVTIQYRIFMPAVLRNAAMAAIRQSTLKLVAHVQSALVAFLRD